MTEFGQSNQQSIIETYYQSKRLKTPKKFDQKTILNHTDTRILLTTGCKATDGQKYEELMV